MPKAILTDIEGTTSSISFVKDVLFPYARRALPGFVAHVVGHQHQHHDAHDVGDKCDRQNGGHDE